MGISHFQLSPEITYILRVTDQYVPESDFYFKRHLQSTGANTNTTPISVRASLNITKYTDEGGSGLDIPGIPARVEQVQFTINVPSNNSEI